MSDEKFLQLLSLQMVILKVNMQIFEYVCGDEEKFNDWKRILDEIEDDFVKIAKQLMEQK